MHNLPLSCRKALVRLPAMRKIARFVAVLAVSLAAGGAAFAQNPVYRVKDLVVDGVAPSAADAGLQGRNAARLAGAPGAPRGGGPPPRRGELAALRAEIGSVRAIRTGRKVR